MTHEFHIKSETVSPVVFVTKIGVVVIREMTHT